MPPKLYVFDAPYKHTLKLTDVDGSVRTYHGGATVTVDSSIGDAYHYLLPVPDQEQPIETTPSRLVPDGVDDPKTFEVDVNVATGDDQDTHV